MSKVTFAVRLIKGLQDYSFFFAKRGKTSKFVFEAFNLIFDYPRIINDNKIDICRDFTTTLDQPSKADLEHKFLTGARKSQEFVVEMNGCTNFIKFMNYEDIQIIRETLRVIDKMSHELLLLYKALFPMLLGVKILV